MSLALRIRRLCEIANHPLSPIPLVVVCVGYWMPLEWMAKGDSILGNSTGMEVLHVIATSVWMNFFPAALFVAASAYALAGTFFLLIRVPFKQVAEKSLDFMALLTLFAGTAKALRWYILGPFSPTGWFNTVSVCVFLLGALWLTRRNFKLMQWMLIPKYITFAVMPLAIILIFIEAENQWHSSRNVHTAGSPLRETGSNTNSHPNIVLITVDTLSAAHLHTYGYKLPTSPHLDEFSSEAILFENFYANANWTRPGIASILNGTKPWTHRGDLGKPLQTVTEHQNLINRLADAGYDIRIVSSNGFADLEWQGVRAAPSRRALLYYQPYMVRLSKEKLPSAFLAALLGPGEILTTYTSRIFPPEKTRDYVPQSEILLKDLPSDHPLFFWLHVISPHDPYATQAPYLGTFESSSLARTPLTSRAQVGFSASIDPERQHLLTGRYDEAVLMADDVIGKFLDVLKNQGLFDRSLVVVTADHGESFNAHYGGHGGPLLTEELIRVPCLIKLPFQRNGKRESLLFEQADLAPTILSFVNLPVPAGMEGTAYPSIPKSVPIFSMNRDFNKRTHTFSIALRDGDWKYVIHLGRWKFPWPQRELYNIAEDPNEITNLVERQPERAESMRQKVLQELARHGVDTKEYQP
jgi:arylsulfatase A-like enzyme